MKKIILLFLLIFLLLPSVCISQHSSSNTAQQSSYYEDDGESIEKTKLPAYGSYWTAVIAVLLGMTIPTAMIVFAFMVIQKKRKAAAKSVKSTETVPPKYEKKCGRCGHKVRDYALYCEMCGNSLKSNAANQYAICPLCKIPMKKHSQSCIVCGISLQ